MEIVSSVANGVEVKRRRGRPRKCASALPADPTIEELASGVGVSSRTLNKYFLRGCPRDSVQSVIRWRSENIEAIANDAEPSELMTELKRAEIAKQHEIARTARLKNDRMEGNLVSRDEVVRELSVVLSRFRNRMLSLGAEAAILCPDALKVSIKNAIDSVVEVAFKEARDGLSEWV